MLVAFFSIFPIVLMITMGYCLRRFWLTSNILWEGMATLSAFIFFPAQLFTLVSKVGLSCCGAFDMVLAILSSTAILCVLLILLHKKYNVPAKQFGCVVQGAVKYNSYVLIGVSSVVFGNESMDLVAVISVYTIFFLTIFVTVWHGVYLIPKSDSSNYGIMLFKITRSTVFNPLIISIFAGILCNMNSIKIHYSLQNFINGLGCCAVCIGSLSIGATLKIKIKKEHFNQVILVVFLKMILFPIMTVIILNLFRVEGLMRQVAILTSCMPISNSATAFSKQLGADFELMSSMTTFSLISTVILVPLNMMLFRLT